MVKLQAPKEVERILFELADIGAKVWNEVNYLRRRQFFNHEKVDFNKTEKAVYEKNTSVKLVLPQSSKFVGRMLKAGSHSSPS